MGKTANYGVRPLEEYRCEKCGERYPQYEEVCLECGQPAVAIVEQELGRRPKSRAKSVRASECKVVPIHKIPTGRAAWDEVLAGGFAYPSSVLVYGQGGIGKSSLLLAVTTHMARLMGGDVLYGSAEMPRGKILQFADRVGADKSRLLVFDDKDGLEFLQEIDRVSPVIVVWDSVQAFQWEGRYGEREQIEIFKRAVDKGLREKLLVILVSQVNKSGDFSGHNYMRHDADCTLELKRDTAGRVLVFVDKNRDGPAPLTACDEPASAQGIIRPPPPVHSDAMHERRGRAKRLDS